LALEKSLKNSDALGDASSCLDEAEEGLKNFLLLNLIRDETGKEVKAH
jgi:hypothetical protein